MNDDQLDDPILRSLEVRLAATAIPLSPDQQQEMLYRCAFAAGQKAVRDRLRRWQSAAVACAVLFVAVGSMLVHDRWTFSPESAKSFDPVARPLRQIFARDDIPDVKQLPTVLELDAWQLPAPENATYNGEHESGDEKDAHLRAFTVGSLTRKMFEP